MPRAPTACIPTVCFMTKTLKARHTTTEHPGPTRRTTLYLPARHIPIRGRYSVVLLVGPGCSVVVWRAFRVFVIKHTVGMHAVGARGIVLEDYLDRVADFRAENRPQNA